MPALNHLGVDTQEFFVSYRMKKWGLRKKVFCARWYIVWLSLCSGDPKGALWYLKPLEARSAVPEHQIKTGSHIGASASVSRTVPTNYTSETKS